MTRPAPEDKAAVVRAMFARIAARYDLMNHLMTFGRDRGWQREVVRLAIPPAGGRLLDIGCGTGGIAKTAGQRRPVANDHGRGLYLRNALGGAAPRPGRHGCSGAAPMPRPCPSRTTPSMPSPPATCCAT
jgi:hypothetical protein